MYTTFMTYFVVFYAIYVLLNVNPSASDCVVTKTKVGDICGFKSSEGDYISYLGIPYAKVDENNPFGPSTPFPNFDHLFEATDDSPQCPQTDGNTGESVGSLDCLRLNVYLPNVAYNTSLPVMVFIHGGAYTGGSASKAEYGPKYLIRQGVILVTLNYRLGPYGFMCLHTPAVPGNQGLKDQLMALRWVKENIEEFGGNKENIVLFGESAGARSVDLHLLSPQEKLFNKAILQSGSILNPGWIIEPDLAAPLKLAETLGLQTANTEEALSFLSQVDALLVISAANNRSDVEFKLCIEKKHQDVEIFFNEHPLIASLPKALNMPILMGYNSQEMLMPYMNRDQEYFESINVFYDKLRNAFEFDEQTLDKMEKIVRKFYIGDKILSEDVKFELADFDSDITYVHATVRNIERYLRNRANNIFYYVFSYNGDRNIIKRRRNITVGGAAHADELGYLFDMEFLSGENNFNDEIIIDAMTTMWANFAKYGNPTPVFTELLPVKWNPITEDSAYHYLNIDLPLKTGKRPFHERLTFWDLMYKNYDNTQKYN